MPGEFIKATKKSNGGGSFPPNTLKEGWHIKKGGALTKEREAEGEWIHKGSHYSFNNIDFVFNSIRDLKWNSSVTAKWVIPAISGKWERFESIGSKANKGTGMDSEARKMQKKLFGSFCSSIFLFSFLFVVIICLPFLSDVLFLWFPLRAQFTCHFLLFFSMQMEYILNQCTHYPSDYPISNGIISIPVSKAIKILVYTRQK